MLDDILPEASFLNLEYIFYRVFEWFRYLNIFDTGSDGSVEFTGWAYIRAIKIILILASMIISALIIYLLAKIHKLREAEIAEFKQAMANYVEPATKENKRWESVIENINSDNEANWRHAIMEADKMLDELLTQIGYRGESLGEKLLAIEKGDMLTLDEAWEAHKYRNKIAHETDFQVPEREAKRIIGLFEKVFREFQNI